MSASEDESIDESLDELGEAADVSGWTRKTAFAFLFALFGAIVLAMAASVYFGLVTPDITLTATLDIGWIIEYVVMGVAGAFLLFTFAMVLVALPGSLVSAIASLAYGIAVQQGYVNEDDGKQ